MTIMQSVVVVEFGSEGSSAVPMVMLSSLSLVSLLVKNSCLDAMSDLSLGGGTLVHWDGILQQQALVLIT